MFAAGGIATIFAVIFSLLFLMLSVWFVNRLISNATQEILVRFILLVFTSLVALFIIDKIVAFKLELISEDQNKELFDLIKTLVLMIFSYYFGTKSDSKNK